MTEYEPLLFRLKVKKRESGFCVFRVKYALKFRKCNAIKDYIKLSRGATSALYLLKPPTKQPNRPLSALGSATLLIGGRFVSNSYFHSIIHE